ncbi:hypothetical protein, partial [Dyella sp. EPa41]|uniref:hypothetical protein n=1 Tax=Dyella sp. EPa41 TaxID=1561194 RepID=UPI001F307356
MLTQEFAPSCMAFLRKKSLAMPVAGIHHVGAAGQVRQGARRLPGVSRLEIRMKKVLFALAVGALV